MLPNQSYLEAGRAARNSFMALNLYMQTHGGRFPPNPAKPPSIEAQVSSIARTESRNGYDFRLDVLRRPREINGTLTSGTESRRSRSAQRNAGGSDRLRTDDGGHYIALRFNGPRDVFNHFAQDANFNRGVYRVLEDKLHKLARNGKTVRVRIVPTFIGASLRPSAITVIYVINGTEMARHFANSPGGK